MQAKPSPTGPRGKKTPPVRPLLDLLVCPVTRTTLKYDAARQELISTAANLAYPIRNGIPVMLASEARKLSDTSSGNIAK